MPRAFADDASSYRWLSVFDTTDLPNYACQLSQNSLGVDTYLTEGKVMIVIAREITKVIFPFEKETLIVCFRWLGTHLILFLLSIDNFRPGKNIFFRNSVMIWREVFFYSDVLMLKSNKANSYLLSLLHPSVQAYHTILVSFQTTNSDWLLPSFAVAK